MKFFAGFAVALFPVFFTPVQSEEMNSLFDLSLKDLLNVKVSVASTETETLVETPAIVSRYNRADLEKMGVSNLREMFNFIPGIIVQTALTGWAGVQIRGIDETFNQKVLFLLDGVPYHQPSHSLIPMEGIPWESISHVEVIRGPGAVFYGSQASGGVLNVITRKDINKDSLSIKVGSDNLKEGSAYISHSISDDATVYIAAEYRDEDGENFTHIEKFPEIGLVSDDVNRYIDRKSGLLRYTNKNLLVQLHAFSDTTVGINDAYTNKETLQPFITRSDGQLVHIENSWESNKGKVKLFADYNFYTFTLQINNLFAPSVDALVTKDNDGKDDYRLRYGGSYAYKINPSLDLIVGAENETRSVGFYRLYNNAAPKEPLATLFEKGSVDEFSAYTQVDYHWNNWRFLVGGRFTENEISGHKVTPRAAAVYKIDQYQSIKALYSTGFNSPNPTQTSIYLPGNVVGNKSLTAEVVKTIDIAYSYAKSNVLFVTNIYALEAEDFIIRRFSEPVNSVSFFNEGNYKRKGAELDFQIANENSKLFANLSYQHDGNKFDIDDHDAFLIPKFSASIGANFDFNNIHSLGGNISYIGARRNLDAFSTVNINYLAKLSKFDVFLTARNLFGEKIINPNNSLQASELVVYGEQGTKVQLGIRAYF